MTLYGWLVLAHIVAAMIWVGGGIVSLATARRVDGSGQPVAKQVFTAVEAWAGAKVFGPAAFSVVLFGLLMVWQSDAWSFGQTWVWLSLALAIASMALGGAFFGPESQRIARIADERGVDDPEVTRRKARVATLQNIDVAVVLVIVVLMVFKPGA